MKHHILEWLRGADEDLTVVTVTDGQAASAEPAQNVRHSPGTFVCFRPDELAGSAFVALGGGGVLDARLLTRIVLPEADLEDFSALAAHLNLTAPLQSAADRAGLAATVWQALLDRLAQLPLGALTEMEALLKPTGHALLPIIEEAGKRALRGGFGAQGLNLRDILAKRASVPPRLAREQPKDPPDRLDVDEVCRLFDAGGALATRFANHEVRPQQLRMAREIAESFNDGLVALLEAGTGTGKSLAYLVPAILWAARNKDPVVISTNTKNLQAQLFTKDLPLLREALGGQFQYALIKGRANYLCIRKLLALLAEADRELTLDERIELLPVIAWIGLTRTGDVADCAGLKLGMQSDLWARLSTRPQECVGPRCRHSKTCFVRHARARALQADVVVANHATIFAEAAIESVALPPYTRIIFDEAHNLEDVATDAFTINVVPWLIPRALNILFRAQRDGAGRGLLATFLHHLNRLSDLPAPARQSLIHMVERAIVAFPDLRRLSDALFSAVDGIFAEVPRYADRLRYDADHRPDDWPIVAQAIGALQEALVEMAKSLEAIQKGADESLDGLRLSEAHMDLADTAAEIAAQAGQLTEIIASLQAVLKAESETTVYWAQRGSNRADAALCAAPLDIAERMKELVFDRARTVIFTSATLSVAGKFDYMRDRLGIRGEVMARVREVDLGTCFDFPGSVLLAVPAFLPEPRQDGAAFLKPFCRLAWHVLRASSGRALVLFTSHATLREADNLLRPALAKHGIQVLAQGVDGDRARLVERLAKGEATALFGTQSFWEGVDVPGEALSVLIVAKLPFRAHTDPIVSARCEMLKRAGRNDFVEYMIPDAVIRLKQGFGRLIRTRQDRGVVVLCDPRVMTKPYGKTFRNSLPVPAQSFADEKTLAAAVHAFLGKPAARKRRSVSPPEAPT